jgi:hypothetical protein
MVVVTGLQSVGTAAAAAGPGPIERSARSEAVRLAFEPPTPGVPPKWLAVNSRVSPGDAVTVTTAGGKAARTFVSAREDGLTVLNFAAPGLPEQARQTLLGLLKTSPGAFVDAANGAARRYKSIEFGPAGIFVGPDKVAEPGEVVEKFHVADVLRISRTVHRGSALTTTVATLGGLFLGLVISSALAQSQCQPACGAAEFSAGLALVGTPVAFGYAAWRSTSYTDDEELYRRP